MDFKNMSDSELASVMVNYINRVGHLRDIIAQYLDKFGRYDISPDKIKDKYRELKNELVFVSCLGFACERRPKVCFRLRALQGVDFFKLTALLANGANFRSLAFCYVVTNFTFKFFHDINLFLFS